MKIRHKLLVVLATTAVLAGLIFGAGAIPTLRNAVRDRFVERLRAETSLLAAFVAGREDLAAAPEWAAAWGRQLGLRVTLFDGQANVIADSLVPPSQRSLLVSEVNAPEIAQASRTGEGEALHPGPAGDQVFFIARKVESGRIGFVRIGLPARELRAVERPFLMILLLIGGATAVLLTALAYVVVSRWSRPLEELAATARRIADGELSLRVGAGPDDEVGGLALALERMRGTLAGKITELEGERRVVDSVISGMKEGLLLVDPNRRVRLANPAFEKAWAVRTDPIDRPLAEIVRHPQVLRAVDVALGEARDVAERVPDSGTGRAFEMHAARLLAGDGTLAGVIVLFFDVTRLEALEAMRKEFVANVSHELRTPITSIKAAVLTLLDPELGDTGADRDIRTRFLDTIRRNSERMAMLVEDLTDLSLIETGAIKLDRRAVDLGHITREVVAQLGPRYTALGLEVQVDMPEPFPLEADRRRLEQVLVNLVDNAMKFNRPGGTIRILGRRDHGRSQLVVEDTGPGIPSEHLDKIFHRFFRVDPTRSQELGGTGLGLAIVKHLVQLHGGTVHAESELGRGSRFVVEL